MSVQLVGLDVVLRNIASAEDKYHTAQALGINETAIAIQKDARYASPVDTGRLRASINLKHRATRLNLSATIAAEVNYAVPVEFGRITSTGRHVAAQPYMVPAMEKNKRSLSKNVAKHMRAVK